MNISLSGKRALVTGGNSGIGQAIVEELAAAGAKVAINYVSHPEAAQAIAQKIWDNGGDAITVEADISDPAAVEAMFAKMDDAWGGVDILINNAGIDGVEAHGWDMAVESFQAVIHINLLGNYYCARQALKRMVPQGSGVVLSTSSVHEMIAWTGHSAYTASKAGIGMLTKTLAQEAAPHGVRVLSLAPGAVKTPINQNVWDNPKGLKDLLEKIPLHRIGEPVEIARMAVVLCSDVASYVTGRTRYVDGGMTDYPDFSHGG
ncbi:MAG TPA: glucose 1-dehydrogenase, partial [Candidatus Saccharimonadales bacterium]